MVWYITERLGMNGWCRCNLCVSVAASGMANEASLETLITVGADPSSSNAFPNRPPRWPGQGLASAASTTIGKPPRPQARNEGAGPGNGRINASSDTRPNRTGTAPAPCRLCLADFLRLPSCDLRAACQQTKASMLWHIPHHLKRFVCLPAASSWHGERHETVPDLQ